MEYNEKLLDLAGYLEDSCMHLITQLQSSSDNIMEKVFSIDVDNYVLEEGGKEVKVRFEKNPAENTFEVRIEYDNKPIECGTFILVEEDPNDDSENANEIKNIIIDLVYPD